MGGGGGDLARRILEEQERAWLDPDYRLPVGKSPPPCQNGEKPQGKPPQKQP